MSGPAPTPPMLPAVDTPPSNGLWVEHDMLELTDDEAAGGNLQGETIDVDNDADNGLNL